jgi:hypothetical protein
MRRFPSAADRPRSRARPFLSALTTFRPSRNRSPERVRSLRDCATSEECIEAARVLAHTASGRIRTVYAGCSHVPKSLPPLQRPVIPQEVLPYPPLARASVEAVQAQPHQASVVGIPGDDDQPVAIRPAHLVGLYPTVCFGDYGRDGGDPRRFAVVAVPGGNRLFRGHLEDPHPGRRPWRAARRHRAQSEADRSPFRRNGRHPTGARTSGRSETYDEGEGHLA